MSIEGKKTGENPLCITGNVSFVSSDILFIKTVGYHNELNIARFVDEDGITFFDLKGELKDGNLYISGIGDALYRDGAQLLQRYKIMLADDKGNFIPLKGEANLLTTHQKMNHVLWSHLSQGAKRHSLAIPSTSSLDSEFRNRLGENVDSFLQTLKTQDGKIVVNPLVYFTRERHWEVCLGNSAIGHMMTQVCHLTHLSMLFRTITLHIEVGKKELTFCGAYLVYHGTDKENQLLEIPFTIVKEDPRDELSIITLKRPLQSQMIQSGKWNVILRWKDKNNHIIPLMVTVNRRYCWYISHVSLTTIRQGRERVYPYCLASGKLAFWCKKPTSYDSPVFYFKEVFAYLIYKAAKSIWEKCCFGLVYQGKDENIGRNVISLCRYAGTAEGKEILGGRILRYCIYDKIIHNYNTEGEKYNPVIFGSIKYLVLFQASKVLITNGIRDDVYPISVRGSLLASYLVGKKHIYVEEGVIEYRDMLNLEKVVHGGREYAITATERDRAIFIKECGYHEDNIITCGFLRFDGLSAHDHDHDYDYGNIIDNKGYYDILIVPEHRYFEKDILKSNYLRMYMSLLLDRNLGEFLQKNGLTVGFLMPIPFPEALTAYHPLGDRIRFVSRKEKKEKDLLEKCRLLITDYSVVRWDALYLRKPIILYTFDQIVYERARGGGLVEREMLFGEIAKTPSEVVELLDKYEQLDFATSKSQETVRKYYFSEIEEPCRIGCEAISRWIP